MFAYLKGKLVSKNPTSIIIDINGIGFYVSIPLSTYDALGEIDTEIKIFTYLNVREDALNLFGFATENEKNLFELLISVSGIGPKVGLGILSGVSANDFKNMVLNKNYAALTSISGIGKKTAERLVIELYDKLVKTEFKSTGAVVKEDNLDIKNQAIQALLSLGFSKAIAEKSVSMVMLSENNITLESLIKKALNYTSK